MRVAFKEWAVVVDALGRGDQILILRKGGIQEGRGGFQPEHRDFFLFPTKFHQQREMVTDAAQKRFDELALAGTPENSVRIEFVATVAAQHRLETLSAAAALRGQHIWRDEVIAERFDWGREQAIFAIAVRVSRLPEAVELPLISAYSGCKSWIELERDISVAGAIPVLDEKSFQAKLARFHSALETTLAATA